MRIILIRHGMTGANLRHLYYGSTDVPLCDEGIAELERLRTQYAPFRDCAFVTSGMKRTEQTLNILFGDVPHRIDPRLREMDFGRFEMKGYDELKDDPDYQAWITGRNEANITPGGESGLMMQRRAIAALDEILRLGADTVIVTHGGVIAAIMEYLFPGRKNRYEWQPRPGRGYQINGKDYHQIP